MCERCWGKAFTAAYGIGSKTQTGEYERIVASCKCTPWQRLGVANGFAEGYEARLAEDAKVRTSPELENVLSAAANAAAKDYGRGMNQAGDWMMDSIAAVRAQAAEAGKVRMPKVRAFLDHCLWFSRDAGIFQSALTELDAVEGVKG